MTLALSEAEMRRAVHQAVSRAGELIDQIELALSELRGLIRDEQEETDRVRPSDDR